MMLSRFINKLISVYYKKLLEKNVGYKLPSVRVMGQLSFENGTLDIGENVVFWPGVTFSGNGRIQIGNGVKVGQDVILYAHNENGGVIIGDNTIIAAQTYIIDSNHSFEPDVLISEQPLTSKQVIIGSDVWIGANVTIIKGSIVHNGAVIGAKSLVNSEIGENEIAYGIPARNRGKRNEQIKSAFGH